MKHIEFQDKKGTFIIHNPENYSGLLEKIFIKTRNKTAGIMLEPSVSWQIFIL